MSSEKVATFQQRFAELLDSSPKSQSTIANEFGVAKQTISAWYNGQSSPRMPTAYALAEYFDVSVTWLMGFDVPKSPQKVELDLKMFSGDNQPRTVEARIISECVDKMTTADREKALNILSAAFSDIFDNAKDKTS